MPADPTQRLPISPPTPAEHEPHAAGGDSSAASPSGTPASGNPVSGSADSEGAADELRALARKAVGLVVGLALLIGCGFAVSHLTAWGERWTMPLVFVLFVLVMMLASNLVVAGATAVWNAARTGAR